MTFAVIALDVRGVGRDLNVLLRGTARKFAPHITLLPRFRAGKTMEAQAWGAQLAARICGTELIELCGPKWIGTIGWYECEPQRRGWIRLAEAHGALLALMLETGGHQIRPDHSGSGFRPHMTAFWDTSEPSRALPDRIDVVPTAIALYEYETDPKIDPVIRTSLLAF